jgi:hypothetical protein
MKDEGGRVKDGETGRRGDTEIVDTGKGRHGDAEKEII